MNDNAKKWIAALRGGKYKQGAGALRDGDHYCCLGVACELFLEENPGAIKVEQQDLSGHTAYEGSVAVLPDVVRDWLGLSTEIGQFGGYSLSEKNDNGTPFQQIADIIEAEPIGLFREGE